jgi:hypothetical protein
MAVVPIKAELTALIEAYTGFVFSGDQGGQITLTRQSAATGPYNGRQVPFDFHLTFGRGYYSGCLFEAEGRDEGSREVLVRYQIDRPVEGAVDWFLGDRVPENEPWVKNV